MTTRGYRTIRGYPRRYRPLLRRFKREVIKRAELRQRRPRRHARPWKLRAKADPSLVLEARAAQGIFGSVQERVFYKALVDHGLIPQVDFTFQSSQLGGRAHLGGLVADFVFEVPKVVVQVQSSWHTLSLEFEARDDDQSLMLQSFGYTVLEIWPNTIEDPVALDWWFERNIMHLFGTSKQNLGRSQIVHNYLMTILDNPAWLFSILEKFIKIYFIITGKSLWHLMKL